MSSVSSSWCRWVLPHFGQTVGRFAWRRSSRRSRRSSRPGCGGPTRAGGRCTSRGCSPSSCSRSCSKRSGTKLQSRRCVTHVDGGLCQRLHLHEPLLGDHAARRWCGSGSRCRRCACSGSTLTADALRFQVFDDGLAGLLRQRSMPRDTCRRRSCAHGARRRSCTLDDHRQVVALADLEVVRVVRRGDLHHAGAELHVDVARRATIGISRSISGSMTWQSCR